MMTVVVLTGLMVLVAGVGARGSRAQALAATSVAFEQCQGADTRSDVCQPFPNSLSAQTEAELAAADRAAGAGPGAEAGTEIGESRTLAVSFNIPTFFLELARYFMRGSFYRNPLVVVETVFDPIR